MMRGSCRVNDTKLALMPQAAVKLDTTYEIIVFRCWTTDRVGISSLIEIKQVMYLIINEFGSIF